MGGPLAVRPGFALVWQTWPYFFQQTYHDFEEFKGPSTNSVPGSIGEHTQFQHPGIMVRYQLRTTITRQSDSWLGNARQ